MALTKARNHMIEGASANVLDYGAVGDGVTDDTVAIQACHDAVVAAGGGTIYLPTGVYHTTAAIDFNSAGLVSMYGEGANVSIISALSCNGINFTGPSGDNDLCFFQDFGLTGESGSTANWAAIQTTLPAGGVSSIDSRDHMNFQRLHIVDWNQGWVATDTWQITIRDCVSRLVNNPVSLGTYCMQWRIINCFFVYETGDSHGGSGPNTAVSINGPVCEGIRVEGTQMFGFDYGIHHTNSIFSEFIGNDMSCVVNCIRSITGGNGSVLNIRDNYMEVRANSGVVVYGQGLNVEIDAQVNFTGNTVLSNNVSHTGTIGLLLNAYPPSNTYQWHWDISNNVFLNTTLYDIYSASAGSLNICNNYCQSTGGTASIAILNLSANNPVFIDKNDCANSLVQTAGDQRAGYLQLGTNVFSGVLGNQYKDSFNTRTFSAGNYTSDSGSWTVVTGNVDTDYFSANNDMVNWIFTVVDTTVVGTPSELRMAIPFGATFFKPQRVPIVYDDNGTIGTGYASITEGLSYMSLHKLSGNWSSATTNTGIWGQLVYEKT